MKAERIAPRKQRERALVAALTSWHLAELRAIQAEWDRRARAAGGITEYSLLDVVGVLITLEHSRLVVQANSKQAGD